MTTETQRNGAALRVGWIGAGRMGGAMAIRVANAGEDLTIWNRTAAKAEPLAAAGGKIATTIAELRDRDVVFTMVSTAADLEQVLLGEGGLLVDPETRARDRRRLLDGLHRDVGGDARRRAPIAAWTSSPRRSAATARWSGRRLSLVVSGPEETYRRGRARCSSHIGKSVTYVGEGDVARLVKIATTCMLGVVDAVAGRDHRARREGRRPAAAFLEFLNNSVMGSVFTRYKSPAFVNLDFTPTFTPVLLRKDFDLGLARRRASSTCRCRWRPRPRSSCRPASGSGRVDEDFAILLDLQAAALGSRAQARERRRRRRPRRRRRG